MTKQDWQVRRLSDGSIDYAVYVREAHASRRRARKRAFRLGARATRRAAGRGLKLLLVAVTGLIGLWHIAPLGPSSRGHAPHW